MFNSSRLNWRWLGRAPAVIGLLAVLSSTASAQILGANFNERPRDVNATLLANSDTPWTRGFYEVLSIQGGSSLSTNPNILGMQRAADAGQELLVSLKWDFKGADLRVPLPGSNEEAALFSKAVDVLSAINRPINTIVLGNEPMFETLAADLEYHGGVVPYVRFTERLLDHIDANFGSSQSREPAYFVGSLNRLDLGSNQSKPLVLETLRVAREDPRIAGLDIHVHFRTEAEAEGMMSFARQQIGADKDLLVTEFSPVWRYQDHLNDAIGATPAGTAFAQKYGYSATMDVDEYLTNAFAEQVTRREWTDFIASQPWFDGRHVRTMHELFEEYGVSIATMGFAQPLSFRGLDATRPGYQPFHINWLYIIGLIDAPLEEAYNEPYMADWLDRHRAIADLNGDGALTDADRSLIEQNLTLDLDSFTNMQRLAVGDLNLDRHIDQADLDRFSELFEGWHASLGDANGDGQLNGLDWVRIHSNFLVDLEAAGIDPELWRLQGDLDNSGIVDRADFRQFKNAYIALYGDAALAALQTVPEPNAHVSWLVGMIGFSAASRALTTQSNVVRVCALRFLIQAEERS